MRKDICPAAGVGFRTALFAGDARSLRLGDEESPGCGMKPDLVITALNQLGKYI
jgi:putative hydrolase of the HAD superfamily